MYICIENIETISGLTSGWRWPMGGCSHGRKGQFQCRSEPNGFETHKVAAVFVQEPVFEPNGFETHKVSAAVVQEPVCEPNGF